MEMRFKIELVSKYVKYSSIFQLYAFTFGIRMIKNVQKIPPSHIFVPNLIKKLKYLNIIKNSIPALLAEFSRTSRTFSSSVAKYSKNFGAKWEIVP